MLRDAGVLFCFCFVFFQQNTAVSTCLERIALNKTTNRNEGGGAEDTRHGNVTGSGADDGDGDDACLRYLSDGGNGFIVGVDGRGAIVATNATTGEPRVLLTPDAARATAAAGADAGATFAAMDYDRSSGIVALAATGGGVDRVAAAAAAATSVDLYELRTPHC